MADAVEASLAKLEVTTEPGPAAASAETAAPEPPAPAPKAALFKKRVVKKGDKLNFPRKGSTVKVNYTGKFAGTEPGVDGAEFDSTYDKKKRSHTPLVVKAGVGKLIAGWDAALLTMSVGEEAVLQIPAEHAYGKAGKKDPSGKVIIPAHQDLVFSVTLLNVMD